MLSIGKKSFWQSVVGKLIRWILYIPLGFIFSIGAMALTSWALSGFLGLKGGWFVFIVISGIIVVAPIAGFALFYMSFWVAAAICPKPKAGMAIFTALFFLLIPIYNAISYFAGTYSPSGIQLFVLAVSCLIALKALYDIRVRETRRFS
jgi:hypothetical protein